MKKLIDAMKKLIDDPKFHVRFNRDATIAWAIILIPTMLWWRESIVWVVFMSWYANFVGHIASWIAALAELKVDQQELTPERDEVS